MSNLPSDAAVAAVSLALTGGGEALLFERFCAGAIGALAQPRQKLLLLLDGEAQLVAEGASYRLQAGEMLRCGQPLSLAAGDTCRGIVLCSTLLDTAVVPPDCIITQPAALRILLRELQPLHDGSEPPRGRFYLRARCHELLILLQQHTVGQGVGRPSHQDERRIQQALALIRQDLAAPPSLAELSRRIGISETKLKRLFRENCGLPVFAYVRELRLLRAKQLIEDGELPLAEIARQVGIRSGGYFARAYRARFGVLPHAAR